MALSGKTHIAPRDVFPFEYSGRKNPDMAAVGKLMRECAADDTPFCLFACSNEPHSPWDKGDASAYPPAQVRLPPYLVDTPSVREHFSRYLAEITYFDGQVGEILALLDKHGLAESTMVMVVSEQGNSFPFAKWTCYDMGLHSGMVVRWPGQVAPGSVSKALVEYVDIAPTFVAAARGEPAPEFDGRSFLPVLQGRARRHKDHVFGLMTTRGIINGTDCYPIRTVRSETHRLIWNPSHESTFTNAATKHVTFQSMLDAAAAGDERAAALTRRYQHREEWELFDVEADPLEQTNLYGRPGLEETTRLLKAELQAWMKSQGDKGIETELAAHAHQARNRKQSKPK